MNPKSDTIYHLLKPGEYRVWCCPRRIPGPKMNLTAKPSKSNCPNCLRNMRAATTGRCSNVPISALPGRTCWMDVEGSCAPKDEL